MEGILKSNERADRHDDVHTQSERDKQQVGARVGAGWDGVEWGVGEVFGDGVINGGGVKRGL